MKTVFRYGLGGIVFSLILPEISHEMLFRLGFVNTFAEEDQKYLNPISSTTLSEF